MFFINVEMFIVCTVLQPPLNEIVPLLLEKPLHAVLTTGWDWILVPCFWSEELNLLVPVLWLKTAKSLAMYCFFCKDGGKYTDVDTVLHSFISVYRHSSAYAFSSFADFDMHFFFKVKVGIMILLKHVPEFSVWDEGSGRMLLGDDTGNGAVMLWLMRFWHVGVGFQHV